MTKQKSCSRLFFVIMELDELCFHLVSNGSKSATFQTWKS